MLKIVIPEKEFFNNRTQEFIEVKEQVICLEHSLLSISKWEAKWKKPFLVKDPPKTSEELADYIRCMTITPNVDPNAYLVLFSSRKDIQRIVEYMEDSQTATTFSDRGGKKSREIITSELVYYWMVSNNIPAEYQKWHINRLLTLIKICNIKNTPPEKMSRKDMLSQRKALNDARRARLGTKG